MKIPVVLSLLGALASAGNASLVPISPSNATASSTIPGSWAVGLLPSSAINGNTSDFFSTNIVTSNASQHIDVGFKNQEKNIKLVRVFPRADGYCFPGTIKLQYDQFGDGGWKDVWMWNFPDPRTSPAAYMDLSFPGLPTTAKAIRLIASNLRPDNYGNFYFQLAEIQVFRDDANPDFGNIRMIPAASAFDDGAIWPSSALTDGNTYSAYSSTASSINQSRNCGIRFASKMHGISKIELYPTAGRFCFPRSFKLAYRDNSSGDWVDIPGQSFSDIVAPPPGVPFVVDLRRNPINAKEIKLVSLENAPDVYGNYYLQLGEIRAYVEEEMQYRYSPVTQTFTFSSTSTTRRPSWASVPSPFIDPIYKGIENHDLWSSKNVDPYDDGAEFSTRPLSGYSALPAPYGFTEAESPAVLVVNYPDAVWVDGVILTPRAQGIGFPSDFSLYFDSPSANQGDFITSFSNYTHSGSEPLFVPLRNGPAWVNRIKIATTKNWTSPDGAFFQLKGFGVSQPMRSLSLQVADLSDLVTADLVGLLIDHSDATGPSLLHQRIVDKEFNLLAATDVKILRIAMSGQGGYVSASQDPSGFTKVEYKLASNGNWQVVSDSYFANVGSEKTVISVPVNQKITAIRVTTGVILTTCVCSDATPRNSITEITPMQ